MSDMKDFMGVNPDIERCQGRNGSLSPSKHRWQRTPPQQEIRGNVTSNQRPPCRKPPKPPKAPPKPLAVTTVCSPRKSPRSPFHRREDHSISLLGRRNRQSTSNKSKLITTMLALLLTVLFLLLVLLQGLFSDKEVETVRTGDTQTNNVALLALDKDEQVQGELGKQVPRKLRTGGGYTRAKRRQWLPKSDSGRTQEKEEETSSQEHIQENDEGGFTDANKGSGVVPESKDDSATDGDLVKQGKTGVSSNSGETLKELNLSLLEALAVGSRAIDEGGNWARQEDDLQAE